MEQEQRYGKRLQKAAREDFRSFWSAHRWWSTIVALLAATAGILIQISVLGVGSVANLELTITTGVGALAVSLLGNYLIAMRRGAERLDSELRGQIAEQNKLITQQPTRTPTEQHYYQVSKAEWDVLSVGAKQIVRHIWAHQTFAAGEPIAGLDTGDVMVALLGELSTVCFLRKRDLPGYPIWWEPVPAYRSAIEELLYTT